MIAAERFALRPARSTAVKITTFVLVRVLILCRIAGGP